MDAWQDRHRLERHGEGDGQGQQSGDHGQRVVVDELGVEGVDGGDVGDVLALGHPVSQDPQAELGLAVDDVEVVVVEASGQAGVDGGDLAAVEDVVARGGQADDVVVGLLVALGLGSYHVDLVTHALQGRPEGGRGSGHAVDGGQVVVDEEGDPHGSHPILRDEGISNRPRRGDASRYDGAGGNMGRANLTAQRTGGGSGAGRVVSELSCSEATLSAGSLPPANPEAASRRYSALLAPLAAADACQPLWTERGLPSTRTSFGTRTRQAPGTPRSARWQVRRLR